MAASSPPNSTGESANFARMGFLIIDVCTDVFRAIMDKHVPSSTFQNVITQSKQSLWPLLNFPQRQFIYPSTGTCSKSYKDMDMSLLYTLIRNLSGIGSPILGWGKPPSSSDWSISANIERLRLIRNEVYGHVTEAKLQEPVFQALWSDIRTVVVDIEMNELHGSTQFSDKIDPLKTSTLDPGMEKMYIEELQKLHLDDTNVKELIQKTRVALEAEISSLQQSLKSEEQDFKGFSAKEMKDELSNLSNQLAILLKETGAMQGNVLALKGQVQAIQLQGQGSEPTEKPQNVENYTLTFLKSFEEDDKYFIETRAYHDATKILQKKYHVTIFGLPGDGKTGIAVHILRKLLNTEKRGVKYFPFKIDYPEEWRRHINPERRQLFLVDDIFGSFGVDMKKANTWLDFLREMERFVCSNGGKTKLIITTRKQSHADLKHRLDQMDLVVFKADSVVDLTSDKARLDEMERREIVLSTSKRFSVSLDMEDVETIARHESHHGFPYCVKLYLSDRALRNTGADFFLTPMMYVVREIDSWRDTSKLEYCALIAILMSDGKLDLNLFDDFTPTSELLQSIMKISGLPENTLLSDIRSSAKRMVGSYLKDIDDHTVEFSHENIQDAVAYSFGMRYPKQFIERASLAFVLKRIKTKSEKTGLDEMAIFISEEQYLILGKRFTDELVNGRIDCRLICEHSICCEDLFLNKWWNTHDEQGSVEKEALEKCVQCTDHQECGKPFLYWATFYDRSQMCTRMLQLLKSMKRSSIVLTTEQLSWILLALCHANYPKNDIELLLALGANPNFTYALTDFVKDVDGEEGRITPLLSAVVKGSVQNVEVLLQNGACVNQRYTNDFSRVSAAGQTPLHIACKDARANLVEVLMAYGANTSASDQKGKTAFWYACQGDDVRIVDLFIKKIQQPIDVNLHYVLNPDIAKLLIREGVDPKKTDAEGRTALYYARTPSIAHVLVANGTKVSKKDKVGVTAIERIAENGNMSKSMFTEFDACLSSVPANVLISYLKAKSCMHIDIEFLKTLLIKCKLNNPLKIRCIQNVVLSEFENKVEVLNTLFIHTKNINKKKELGWFIHLLARKEKNVEVLDMFINEGADIDYQTEEEEQTPLMQFAYVGKNRKQFIERLLKKGADRNLQNKTNKTALHYFVMYMDVQDYIEVIDSTWDFSVRDVDGNTALDCCLQQNHDMSEVMKIFFSSAFDVDENTKAKALCHLVEYSLPSKITSDLIKGLCGCPNVVNQRNREGKTALHVALKYRKDEFGKLLLENGADVTALDSDGNTPLHAYFSPPQEIYMYFYYHVSGRITQEGSSDETGLISYLLSKTPDLDAENKNGQTPLNLAASYNFNGQRDITDIEFLLKSGANVHAVDCSGDTVLHKLLWSSRSVWKIEHLLGEMISFGADVTVVNAYDRSLADIAASRKNTVQLLPLLMASKCKYQSEVEQHVFQKILLYDIEQDVKNEILSIMVSDGYNVNAMNDQRQTHLMLALQASVNAKTISLLLKLGANVQVVDSLGQNVFHHLFQTSVFPQNDKEIVKTLNKLTRCLNPGDLKHYLMARNVDGKTPLHLCLKQCLQTTTTDEVYDYYIPIDDVITTQKNEAESFKKKKLYSNQHQSPHAEAKTSEDAEESVKSTQGTQNLLTRPLPPLPQDDPDSKTLPQPANEILQQEETPPDSQILERIDNFSQSLHQIPAQDRPVDNDFEKRDALIKCNSIPNNLSGPYANQFVGNQVLSHFARLKDFSFDRCKTVTTLLVQGATIEDEAMASVLFRLCLKSSDIQASETLLKQMIHCKVDVNLVIDGLNYLTKALNSGAFRVAKIIIENGGDVQFKDSSDNTVYHHCVLSAVPDEDVVAIVNVLVTTNVNIHCMNAYKETPLDLAVGLGDERLKTTRLIFELTSKLSPESFRIQLRLILKCFDLPEEQTINTFRFLLQQLPREDDCYREMLRVSCSSNDSRYFMIKEIIEHMPMSINVELDTGSTALHLIVQSKKNDWDVIRLVKLFQENDADLNVVPRKKCSVLHLAARYTSSADFHRVAVVELLLKKGCNPSIKDHKGRTPLHYVTCSFTTFEQELLDESDSIPVINEEDEMPETVDTRIAAASAKLELLLKHGGRAQIKDCYGKYAADYLPSAIWYKRLKDILNPDTDDTEPTYSNFEIEEADIQQHVKCWNCVLQ